jgi:RNA polymerase subunit RPABC4/transcription elongation factor Spt4
MAMSHARVCGACERECPSWAERCPVCGSSSLVRQIVVEPVSPVAATSHTAASPVAAPVSTKPPPRRKPSRPRSRAAGQPHRHGTPAHSTA